MHMYRNTPHGKPQWARPVYPDMTHGKHPLGFLPGRRRQARLRSQSLHQLALFLGLFRRQRLRKHVPPDFLLVQGAEPPNSQGGDHDRRSLSLEGRPRSSRHHERRHRAARGNAHQLGFRFRQQRARRHRRRARHRRHHFQRPADPLRAAESQPARRRRTARDRPRHRPSRTCRISSIASAPARKPTAPSISASGFPIACRMAVDSYRSGRTMRWDPVREEIV